MSEHAHDRRFLDWDKDGVLEFASCVTCKWKHDYKATCRAFPEGIPEKILTGEHRHLQPYEGDHGIRYTPIQQ